MTDAMTPVSAPWTDEQIRALEAWQELGHVHPYTCPADDHHGHSVSLVPTTDGWVCPVAEPRRVVQAWAYHQTLDQSLHPSAPSWSQPAPDVFQQIARHAPPGATSSDERTLPIIDDGADAFLRRLFRETGAVVDRPRSGSRLVLGINGTVRVSEAEALVLEHLIESERGSR